jgi:tRNA threonylcarbamoyladenosine biosynthesis protein TsaB
MQILAFDTSTEWLSVALYDGRRAVTASERAGSASSERVLPLIARTLAQCGTSLATLDGIAYGAGPGSFTGVRIACGVAQGLAFGADLPVFGVPTLGAIAHAAWRSRGTPRVIACLDARMHEVYVAAYARAGDVWTIAGEPVVRKPDEVDAPPSDDWHGAGGGFAAYPELAARLRLASCDPAVIPDAQSIAEWAWPHLLAGEGVPAAQAEPLYVRHRVALTSAERAAGLRL